MACAEMALNHLGLAMDYARVAKILRAGADFTPFTNLHYLEQLGLSIILGEQGDATLFETHIASGLPVLVAVRTLNWLHWEEIITEHAVVVVGIAQAHNLIYIHDPYLAEAPIAMELLRFEMGWEEKKRRYAVNRVVRPLKQRIRDGPCSSSSVD